MTTYYPKVSTGGYNRPEQLEIEYRGFILVRDPEYSLWGIKGESPKQLAGKYTTEELLQTKIDYYLEHIEAKKEGKIT